MCLIPIINQVKAWSLIKTSQRFSPILLNKRLEQNFLTPKDYQGIGWCSSISLQVGDHDPGFLLLY